VTPAPRARGAHRSSSAFPHCAVDRITTLHSELSTAWDNAERVQALKRAIQCAKSLATITVPQCYPSVFVMVTEILDTFGKLVFNRIKDKSSADGGPLRGGVRGCALCVLCVRSAWLCM